MRTSAIVAFLLVAGSSSIGAADLAPIAHWGFDRVDTGKTPRRRRSQRSYVVTGSGTPRDGQLRLRLNADADSPVHNPAIVVEDWGSRGATLEIDGNPVPSGKDFRFGHIRRVNRYDLVVWIRREATGPLQLSLSPS